MQILHGPSRRLLIPLAMALTPPAASAHHPPPPLSLLQQPHFPTCAATLPLVISSGALAWAAARSSALRPAQVAWSPGQQMPSWGAPSRPGSALALRRGGRRVEPPAKAVLQLR